MAAVAWLDELPPEVLRLVLQRAPGLGATSRANRMHLREVLRLAHPAAAAAGVPLHQLRTFLREPPTAGPEFWDRGPCKLNFAGHPSDRIEVDWWDSEGRTNRVRIVRAAVQSAREWADSFAILALATGGVLTIPRDEYEVELVKFNSLLLPIPPSIQMP